MTSEKQGWEHVEGRLGRPCGIKVLGFYSSWDGKPLGVEGMGVTWTNWLSRPHYGSMLRMEHQSGVREQTGSNCNLLCVQLCFLGRRHQALGEDVDVLNMEQTGVADRLGVESERKGVWAASGFFRSNITTEFIAIRWEGEGGKGSRFWGVVL